MNNEFPTNVFVASPWDDIAAVREQVANIPETLPDVVDSLDAAAILTVTSNNLRQMVHKGLLTPVGRRGRRTLFARSEVQALADRRSK